MRRVSCVVCFAALLTVVNHAPAFAQTVAPGFTVEGRVLDAMVDISTNVRRTLDPAGQQLFEGVMGKHLASGGIVIAATHAPLGIETRELRMGDAT